MKQIHDDGANDAKPPPMLQLDDGMMFAALVAAFCLAFVAGVVFVATLISFFT